MEHERVSNDAHGSGVNQHANSNCIPSAPKAADAGVRPALEILGSQAAPEANVGQRFQLGLDWEGCQAQVGVHVVGRQLLCKTLTHTRTMLIVVLALLLCRFATC